MKNVTHLPSMLRIVFVVLCFNVFALGQSEVAKVSGLGSTVRFDVGVPHAAVTLSVSTPDGEVITKEFQSGNTAEFKLIQKGERLPDGQYTYELRVTPNISAEVKEALKAARAKDNAREVQRDMRKRGVLPQALVQSGSFTILNGSAIVAGAGEERVGTARVTAEPPAGPVAPAVSSGRMSYKVQRHHPRFMMFDQVIPDDLIVQGSGCFGFDCVNNENFGFDTIRLKENNLRIGFDDTSSSAGFATNNWQIRANDSTSGGANFLGFVAVHHLGPWRSRFGHALFHCGAASVECVGVRIPGSRRIVDPRVTREVSILRNHRACRGIAFDRRRDDFLPCARPLEARDDHWRTSGRRG